jgi:glycosyltransferase involved in cell wall biosynthesis
VQASDEQPPKVAVYLVTHRRHALLKRALASVLAQSHRDLMVRVVNDDPSDREVERIIASAEDNRAALFQPCIRRGPTRNFNLMFSEREARYVSLLEDDNWWEPNYVAHMLSVLEANGDDFFVLSNERIWKEMPDASWNDTERCVWPFSDVRRHRLTINEVAGSARLCNSGMFFRLDGNRRLTTPDTIPPDVSEHFRERMLPRELLLSGAPLVNFALTRQTVRSNRGELWGFYHALLIGSLFVALHSPLARRLLAKHLWSECSDPTSPRGTSLMATALAIKEARSLLREAPALGLLRFTAWLARDPSRLFQYATARRKLQPELDWLVDAPLTREIASTLEAAAT